jgi:hypothetical protein
MQLRLITNEETAHRRRPARLPQVMPAAAIDHFGGPEVLTLHVVRAPALKVPIAEAYPLARAATAHQRLAEGGVLGKTVLRTRES